MEKYILVSFEHERPKNGWFCDGINGWLYDNGLVKCPHSGVVQQGVNLWLKKIIEGDQCETLKQDYKMLTEIRTQLKARRKELGLSAQKVADLSKSTQAQILNFENGKANITVHLLEKICITLGVKLTINF